MPVKSSLCKQNLATRLESICVRKRQGSLHCRMLCEVHEDFKLNVALAKKGYYVYVSLLGILSQAPTDSSLRCGDLLLKWSKATDRKLPVISHSEITEALFLGNPCVCHWVTIASLGEGNALRCTGSRPLMP